MSMPLIAGSSRYASATPWRPLSALLASIAILFAFQGAAMLLATSGMVPPMKPSGPPGTVGTASGEKAALVAFLALSQLSIILLTAWVAGWFGGRRGLVLQMVRGRLLRGELLASVVGLIVIVGAFNGLIYLWRPDDLLADLQSFRPMIEGPQWPLTVLAIAIGAPLSEELLFRGFLLSALAASRLGFWPAALIVNGLWTALHYGYSVPGLMEVYAAGLYLSWLVWRTGSLWPALVCHALANVVSLALLALLPEGP